VYLGIALCDCQRRALQHPYLQVCTYRKYSAHSYFDARVRTQDNSTWSTLTQTHRATLSPRHARMHASSTDAFMCFRYNCTHSVQHVWSTLRNWAATSAGCGNGGGGGRRILPRSCAGGGGGEDGRYNRLRRQLRRPLNLQASPLASAAAVAATGLSLQQSSCQGSSIGASGFSVRALCVA